MRLFQFMLPTIVVGTVAVIVWHRRRRVVRRRVLVTGASGFLGQHFLADLAGRHTTHELHATYSNNVHFVEDWSSACTCHRIALDDEASITQLMDRVRPDVVVHLAAISSPAKAEANPALAKAVNAPRALLDALPPHARLVFLSTDQVYDGMHAPYCEDSATEPVNVYGQTKLEFERAIAERAPERAIVLRMSLLLGPAAPRRSLKKNSFLQDCARMLKSGQVHDFFSDEIRSVVYIEDVLHVLRWAVGSSVSGVFNMGGPGRPSRADVAHAVARHLDLSESGINALPRPPAAPGQARSPPNIAMDSSRLELAAGLRFRPLEYAIASSL
jgi:dTDP-4-dehydrorhamnose reductase